MPVRGFSGGGGPRNGGGGGPGPRGGGGMFGGGPRGPERREPRREPRRGGGLFSGVRLFHGPIRFMFFGRPIFISTGRQIGFIAGFLAILIMLVSTLSIFGSLSTYKEDKAYYETEYAEYVEYGTPYLNIISNAEAGEDGYGTTTASYKKSGKGSDTTGIVYTHDEFYESCYYIVYSFSVDGTIYYQATLSDYYGSVPSSLTIAYYIDESGEITAVETDFTESMAYKLAVYQSEIDLAKSSIKTMTVAAVILILIIILIVALVILSIVKVIKNSKKQQEIENSKREAELREAEAKAKVAEAQADLKYRYCEYCGAKFPEDEDKCPNCGSSHFVIKK